MMERREENRTENKKSEYVTPRIEIVEFSCEDVITASITCFNGVSKSCKAIGKPM